MTQNIIIVFFHNIFNIIVTIRCIWGPKLCFFEKNSNIYRIDDTSVDMYQRILTYEVDKPLILKESLIGRILPNKLEHQTFNLVDVYLHYYNQISIYRL